jgi:hypothetical protein
MSKQRKKKPTGGDPYRRGYGNGVTAAVDAVLDDLDAAGKLDWVEHGADRDDRATTCKGCILRHEGFDVLATRWEFALGLERHGGDSPGYVTAP